MNQAFHPLIVLLAAVAPIAGCDPRTAPPRPAAAAGPDVLALVNGVPVTERDLEHRARRPGAAMGMGPAAEPSSPILLQAVVQDEIIQQKAVELGLDRDPEYRARLDDLEAQVRLFRRRELASRLRTWAQEQATVSDAEARAWFDRNAPLLRTRYRVFQIFGRGQLTDLLEASAEIRQGTPFEETARKRLGPPGEGRAPWDLGELSWYQFPPAWRGIVDQLQPGEVSPVIRGEGERGWIVKLEALRVDPAVTFEGERARIVAMLRTSRAEDLLARTIADAKASAAVTFAAPQQRALAQAASAE